MAVVGINYSGCGHDYDENGGRVEKTPSTLEYHSVYLHTQTKKYVFDSGNFVKDWYDAKKQYTEIQEDEPFLSGSSTCDHFFMDGADFDSAYLHLENDKGVLKYLDKTEDELWFLSQKEVYEEGWEFFVPKGTQPTWEELKEMCK